VYAKVNPSLSVISLSFCSHQNIALKGVEPGEGNQVPHWQNQGEKKEKEKKRKEKEKEKCAKERQGDKQDRKQQKEKGREKLVVCPSSMSSCEDPYQNIFLPT